MQGGVALNMVPERAEIEFEIRHLAEDSPNDIIEALRKCAPKSVEIEQVNSYPGFNGNFADPMWEILRGSLEMNEPIKVPFGTEAGFSQIWVCVLWCVARGLCRQMGINQMKVFR